MMSPKDPIQKTESGGASFEELCHDVYPQHGAKAADNSGGDARVPRHKNDRMRRALILSSICATAWCAASPAKAIGFGATQTPSLLGQPLDFAAQVRISADEALTRECVSAEVFAGENRLGSDQIRVQVAIGRSADERAVRVRTLHALNEPIVTINLTVGCGSRVARQFVAFLDPPLLNLARADDSSTPQVESAGRAGGRGESQFAMASQPNAEPSVKPSIRQRNRGAERRRNVAAVTARPAPSVRVAEAASSVSKQGAQRPAIVRAGSMAKPTGTARLQLESATTTALASAPAASAVVTAPVPSEQPAVQFELEQLKLLLAQEKERVRSLEATLARLRNETGEANQKRSGTAAPVAAATATALAFAAPAAKPEPQRAASPMLYPLVGFGALLAVAVGIAAWRPKKKAAGTSRWWDLSQQPVVEKKDAVASRFDSVRSESEDLRAQLPPRVASALSTSRISELTSLPIGLEVTTVAAQAPTDFPAAHSLPAAQPTAAAPSMELLIDLEQEAEFFTVIGQDEAAVALLSKHIQREGPISPLPFLKLLEIHRRRGDTASQDRVTVAFRTRFSTSPPASNANGGGRSLDAYPSTLVGLQALWSSPREVMSALEAWLFRRGPSAEIFDLAAYRDLLFLYAVARDRADRGGTADGELDLVLPLDDSPIDVHLPIGPAAPAAGVTEPRISRSAPLDFDISVSASLDESELRQPV